VFNLGSQLTTNEFDELLMNSLVDNNLSIFIKGLITFTMVNFYKFIQNIMKHKMNLTHNNAMFIQFDEPFPLSSQ
jgi:hypothetical protein